MLYKWNFVTDVGVWKSKEFEFNLLNKTEVEHKSSPKPKFLNQKFIAENEFECPKTWTKSLPNLSLKKHHFDIGDPVCEWIND